MSLREYGLNGSFYACRKQSYVHKRGHINMPLAVGITCPTLQERIHLQHAVLTRIHLQIHAMRDVALRVAGST